MRSIKARFKRVELEHPDWSSYVVFSSAIHGQGFCEDMIHRHFNQLVDKDDYHKSEKKEILRFLVLHSKGLRNTENDTKKSVLETFERVHDEVVVETDKQ